MAGQWLPGAQRAPIHDEHQRACSRASVASGPWARPIGVWAAGAWSCMRAVLLGAACCRLLPARAPRPAGSVHLALSHAPGAGMWARPCPGRCGPEVSLWPGISLPMSQARVEHLIGFPEGVDLFVDGALRPPPVSLDLGSRTRRRAAATAAWLAPVMRISLWQLARFCDRHRHRQG